ncbi:hypothetical protein [Salinicoccus roseus]|uniref:hypothetical protein n=1 Tax=Salinicoccus roseus TaxID=45670 RepID=UPI002300BF0C|nr:hypothetical protein [Salinicoccus roseus]
MNLLSKEYLGKSVHETEQVKVLTIDGIKKNYKVYKVDIDLLYYNTRNDRIASYIFEHSDTDYEAMNKKELNEKIQAFITSSNADNLKKTKISIQNRGQDIAGVSLKDGRVIDGNRRFTCLRMIQNEKHENQYFETVILEEDINDDRKRLKKLELNVQHAIEEKIEYNPIDRYVGLYNDIIRDEMFTIPEYAKETGRLKPNGQPDANYVKGEVDKAKLMVEFLQTFNMKDKFHIARELNMGGPLYEFNQVIKNIKDEDEKEIIKQIMFTTELVKPQPETKHLYRNIGKIMKSKEKDNFLEDAGSLSLEVQEEVKKKNTTIDASFIRENIRADEPLKTKFRSMIIEYHESANIKKQKEKVIDDFKKINSILDTINRQKVKDLDKNNKNELEFLLKEIEGKLKDISKVMEG